MDSTFAPYAWVCLPFLVAAGSGLLAAFIMQARMEVALATQRESLAETRALLASQRRAAEEQVRAAEESTRRKALDEFLSEIRIEERHYIRESKSLLLNQRSLVLQERIFFRNLPLSDWVEHEFSLSEGIGGRLLSDVRSAVVKPSLRPASAGKRLLGGEQHPDADREQEHGVYPLDPHAVQ